MVSSFNGAVTKFRREKNMGVMDNTNDLFNCVNGDYMPHLPRPGDLLRGNQSDLPGTPEIVPAEVCRER